MKKYIIGLAIIVPAIEIALFYVIIQWIGIWATIMLMLLTSTVGLFLARKEGLNAIRVFRLQASKGEPPTGIVLDGICIFIGGILLLLPGFLTDVIGFLLFLPITRTVIKAFLIKWMHRLFRKGQVIVMTKR